MGSIAGDEVGSGGGGKEMERILVSVRIRPLSVKEREKNDPSDWEGINSTTIIFKNSLAADRSMYPAAYSFDRVFGCESTTKQVYEEGAKEVALSVVSGINSSIFAYGQTSSGKTYTMTGITEYSVSDIYNYIHKHSERKFVLKFSALEIYNEAVKDLLRSDSPHLRLLDDPEKGTIVEKLTEETLRDQDHLKELLSFCEAQRQIGETKLNELSSRSHQILRLTIESSAKEFVGKDTFSTLAATVNFVDLAGSERASQALTAGTRLKEGCHINRSLLTLGTVIRKLSKGRTGHIPYRDSKLTRILQSSLGGNARTAIICTMSPARSHIEQTRNTLLFASCAKEVTTSAQVNVVMSDKALVKHLQRELARLGNELRFVAAASPTSQTEVLMEKDAQIKKMEREMKALTQQRDLAQSRLEDLLRAVGDDHASREWEELSQSSIPHLPNYGEDTLSISSGIDYQSSEFGIARSDVSRGSSSYIEHHVQLFDTPNELHAISPPYQPECTPSYMGHEVISPSLSQDFEDHCKEVQCIETVEPRMERIEDFNLLLTEESDSLLPPTIDAKEHRDHETNSGERELRLETSPLPTVRELTSSGWPPLVRSRSCRAILMHSSSSPWFPEVEERNDTPPDSFVKDFSERSERARRRFSAIDYGVDMETRSKDELPTSEQRTSDLKPQNFKIDEGITDNHNSDVKIDEGITDNHNYVEGLKEMFQNLQEEKVSSSRVHNYVEGLKEMVQIMNEEKVSSIQEPEYQANSDSGVKITIKDVCIDPVLRSAESPSRWPLEFEKKQREIVELWHTCSISLIHRTCFFLFITGDPLDSNYMEVEHRRLSFLRNSSSEGSIPKPPTANSPNASLASRVKNVRREREMLRKQLHKKLPAKERESLYKKWGIALDSKRRRLQLASRLWTDTKDMEHVRESALLVAKLVGLPGPGQASKEEVFGLSFAPQQFSRRSFSWRDGMSSFG